MSDDIPDLCTAGLDASKDDPLALRARQATDMEGMLHCSLPAHTRGSHKAFRQHDTGKPPPLFSWPYSRDDQPEFAEHAQEVTRLAALPERDLLQTRANNTLARLRLLRGLVPRHRKPELDGERDRIHEAEARRFFGV